MTDEADDHRAAWNARYAASDELVWAAEPNRFLPGLVAGLTPGRALDLACGEGRNAVWLAAQGWDVLGVDFAAAGLAKARRLAAEHGVDPAWQEEDVTTWCPPAAAFDLVLVFYLHLPAAAWARVVAAATAAVAPGGTLLLVGHDRRNLTEGIGGPQDPAVLATAEEVADAVRAAGVAGVTVDRAEAVHRPVVTDEGEVQAVDRVVVARRGAAR